jgi:hypothetical protein
LLGPLGLTVALGFAVLALWRDHLRADADDRVQRSEAIAGWREQTAATNRLADAIEADIRDRAQRQRRADRT